MAKFPDKCSRCGAPISWKEGASSVECDFCGNINYSKKNIFNFNISKNKLIFPIKDFLINKKILNTNQIDYINDKTSKLFEKRLFRLSILLIFISTPIVIYKNNRVDSRLTTICSSISDKKSNNYAAKKSFKNCIKKIKLVDNVFPGDLILEYFVSKKAIASYYGLVDNYLAKDIKELKNELKEKIRLKKEAKAKEETRLKKEAKERSNPYKFAKVYYNSGNAKYRLKDYSGAISDYTKAINLDPDYAEAYTNRGAAKRLVKDYTGAISDCTKAINLTPDDFIAYNNRGNAKNNLNDFTGAISDYTKAINLNPNDALAYGNRGVAKSNLKDYTGAISDYTKAINLNPDYAEAYANLAKAKKLEAEKKKKNTKVENFKEQIKQTAKENKSKNSFQLSKADKEKWCEYDNSNGENILGVNRCIENLESLGPKFSSISFKNHKKCFPNPKNSPNLSSYISCLEMSGDKSIYSLVKGIKSEDIARIDYLQLKSDWEKK